MMNTSIALDHDRTSPATSERKTDLVRRQLPGVLLLLGSSSSYSLSISPLISLLLLFPARSILQYLTVVCLQFQIANAV